MSLRVPTSSAALMLAVLLAACSSGKDDGTPSDSSAAPPAPPTLRVPDVLPGSGANTTIKTPLPGGITPSFEYTVVAEVAAGANMTSVALETPLGAREAIERLSEQFTQAGLAATRIREERKRKTNALTGYSAAFSSPGGIPDTGGVTVMANDRDGQPAALVLLVRTP